jgi:hypothetical protein
MRVPAVWLVLLVLGWRVCGLSLWRLTSPQLLPSSAGRNVTLERCEWPALPTALEAGRNVSALFTNAAADLAISDAALDFSFAASSSACARYSAPLLVPRGTFAPTDSSAVLQLSVQANDTASGYGATPLSPLIVYDPARLVANLSVSPQTVSVTGWEWVTLSWPTAFPLVLAAGDGSVPSAGVLLRLCACSNAECVTVAPSPPTLSTDSQGNASTVLQFFSPSFASRCPSLNSSSSSGDGGSSSTGRWASLELSLNAGSDWHDTNQSFTLTAPAPLRIGFMYPFPILGSEWVASHLTVMRTTRALH